MLLPAHGPPVNKMRVKFTLSSSSYNILVRVCLSGIPVYIDCINFFDIVAMKRVNTIDLLTSKILSSLLFFSFLAVQAIKAPPTDQWWYCLNLATRLQFLRKFHQYQRLKSIRQLFRLLTTLLLLFFNFSILPSFLFCVYLQDFLILGLKSLLHAKYLIRWK